MAEAVWEDILKTFESSVSRPNFVTWLKPTRLQKETEGHFTVLVPNYYTKNWIESNALKDIKSLLSKRYGRIEDLRVVVVKGAEKDLGDLPLLKSVELDEEIETKLVQKNTQFNSKYTFETFVVGNNNRLAFAAAEVVADKPGEAYNPLFLYGGVGLGKTHLMQAIGNRVLFHSPKKKIIYTSCETFTTDFISALQNKTIGEFKNRYRNVDVLLVDDIQFLANKEGTQEEFFHTFNILHQANRQIVMTADRLPKEITELEDRLTSRLGWGMVADVQIPNFETRLAILQSKAKERGIEIDSNVLGYVANTITQNVRELEGSLIKLITTSQIEGEPITEQFAAKVLRDLASSSKTNLTSKAILRTVAQYFELEQSDISGSKRNKELVYSRQIVMYLMRQLMRQSYPQIGESLGGKDHTTIMHGVQRITEKIKNEPAVENDVRKITQLLNIE